MTIKFGYHTWSYSGFGAWVPSYTLDETIKRLGKIGFDGIEIGAASPHAYPPDLSSARRREIRGLLDDHGLELAGIGAAPGGGPGYNPASPSPEERRATAEHYKELSGLCAEWGGRTVLYVPGWTVFGTRRRQARAWSLECLTEIAVDAAQYDVTVVIEPLAQHSNLIDDGEDAMELLEDVGLPNVKVMFDCNHVSHRQELFGDYVHLMGGQLHQVHISDSTATEVRLPAGKGDGDWEGLVDALIETGFDGYLTAETGFLRRGISPDQDAREGLRFLKTLVEGKLAEQVCPAS